jgi:hypothetical protein
MTRKRKNDAVRPGKDEDFPAAALTFYGPDDRLVTKIVVGIVETPSSEPDPMRKWLSEAGDLRADENVGKEIADFMKANKVKKVITSGRIMGCPHEEGKDYPEGSTCPACPFWSGRDRFTGEPGKKEN